MSFTGAFLAILWLLVYNGPFISCKAHGHLRQDHDKIESDNSVDFVTDLPGQPKVDFRHYAGYVTVNQQAGRALFYWFFEAAQPNDKPLVLWLNGGPGCSSVGYGASQEIGPFLVGKNAWGIISNPHSWNKVANVLFLESPVGVGFSYSNTSSDYDKLGDEFTANDTYSFLINWFAKFPSYKSMPFYIAGESYAGKYVPELAELIYEKNKLNPPIHIDLRGILLGNPETDDAEDTKGSVDYAWSHAIISDETHKMITDNCDFNSNNTFDNVNCTDAFDELLKQYNEIDIYSLYIRYTPKCIGQSAKEANGRISQAMLKRSFTAMTPRMLVSFFNPCLDDYAKAFYNRPDVQKALHVSNGVQLKNWSICNYEIFNNWIYTRPSVLPIYEKLIAAELRIWVYSGDVDGRVPVLSTRYSLNTLGLPINKTWSPWYHEKQVSGWYQEYKGLTFATFRGAGHEVPTFKPSEALVLFSSFLSGQRLPSTR